MKSLVILLCSLSIAILGRAQYVYTIKADSVLITNNCDSAELIIQNHTQGVPGFLFNTGNGRTIFKRALTKVSDSLYLIGADTLKVPSGQGLSGGNTYILNQYSAQQNANSWYVKNMVDTLTVNKQFVAYNPGVVNDSSFFSVDTSGDTRGMFYMFGPSSRYVELGWTGGGAVDFWCNQIHVDTAASFYGAEQENGLYTFWQTTYFPNSKPTYRFYPHQHGPGGAQPPMVVSSTTTGRAYSFTNAPILGYYLLGGNSPTDTNGNTYGSTVVFVIDTAGNGAFNSLQVDGKNASGQAMYFANNSLSSGAATDSLLTDSAGYVRHVSISRLPIASAANGLTDSAGTVLLGGNLYKGTDLEVPQDSLFGIDLKSSNYGSGFFACGKDPYFPLYMGVSNTDSTSYGYQVFSAAGFPIEQDIYANNNNIISVFDSTISLFQGNSEGSPNGIDIFGSDGYVEIGGYESLGAGGLGPVFEITGKNYGRPGLLFLGSYLNSDTTAFLQTNRGGAVSLRSIRSIKDPHSIVSATSGGSATLTNDGYTFLQSSTTLSSFTINFPSSPVDGDKVTVKSQSNITSVSWSAGSNSVAAPINLTAGQSVVFVFDNATSTWY
ncbi:hypothetical protein [Dinghuibacter silviterrae]|uniref:Uncharacterized protein n=1 Tax=Dinghuibacter silviterrae TaxID=1539049 RepID=A0A4R8DVF7_9BACT|nr:hypothetical protein [Dinghuibacter silviterrae]TDX02414.1 hypothetical protein EDB95_3472 [Dinghuibacter silviterrae]